MSHLVTPNLATSPNAQTSEVQPAINTMVGYTEDSDDRMHHTRDTFVDWITAIQAAVLRVASYSRYGDVAADAKNAALVRQRQGRISTILAGERPQLTPTQNAPGVAGSPTLG